MNRPPVRQAVKQSRSSETKLPVHGAFGPPLRNGRQHQSNARFVKGLSRRVAQAPDKPRKAEPTVGRAARLGLELLELHHAVDAAVEEPRRLGPPLALVVKPGQQRRTVDRA